MPPELSPIAGQPAQPDPPDSLVTTTLETVDAPVPDLVTHEPPPVAPPVEEGKLYTVPEAKFKELKEKAHEKGRKAAEAELAKQAKEAGFESTQAAFAEIDKLKSKLKELSQQPKPAAKEQPTMATKNKKPTTRRNSNSKGARMDDRNVKEIARLEREKGKAREQWRKEEKRRKVAERKLAAKEAEIELRQIAMEQGVKDVDYAIRLMTRELKGKSKEELATFSEADFFVGLKPERPYLFGETTIPATTGTGAGDEDTPLEPKPGEVLTNVAAEGHFDARNASQADIKKRLGELGLNTSGSVGIDR